MKMVHILFVAFLAAIVFTNIWESVWMLAVLEVAIFGFYGIYLFKTKAK